jgi:predicted dehydrogenase
MNILISGFGQMGCRHAQSLLTSNDDYSIHIIEPSDEAFETGLSTIGASKNDFTRYQKIEELNAPIDLAISATCSKPRYSILLDLIEYGIKYFLLEKVVFQSLEQFDIIIEKLKSNGAVAYSHFPRRYYKNFTELKSIIRKSNSPISINVYGGNNGIGCNAIHFMDLFEFLTGSNICKSSSCLKEDKDYDRRGPDYTDVNGLLVLENYNKDQLSIYFDPTFRAGVTEIIENSDEKYIFSTRDKKEYQFINDNIDQKEFEVLYSSELTKILVKDILEGNTKLPTVEETRNAHSYLFKMIMFALGKKLNSKTLCPIT